MIDDAKPPKTEFVVYTFDKPQNPRIFEWRRHAIYTNYQDAMFEAKSLFQTNRFARIEIKKKFFDFGKNRAVDSTVKIFKNSTFQKIKSFFSYK